MEAAESQSFSKTRKIVIAVAVLAVVSLAGYIPGYIDARDARSERDRLDARLQLVTLCNRIGMAHYEANRNNYASAMEHSSEFFDNLQGVIARSSDGTLRERLQTVMNRRDEITAGLTRANPAVKEKLMELYPEFFQLGLPDQSARDPRNSP